MSTKKKLVLYETYEQKVAFIKENNIVTFFDKVQNFHKNQVGIQEIRYRENGNIQLVNPFGTKTIWFESLDALIQLLDWETMDAWHQI